MYLEGRGVLQDDEKAIYWFTLAAEQGDITAQASLTKILEGSYYVVVEDETSITNLRLIIDVRTKQRAERMARQLEKDNNWSEGTAFVLNEREVETLREIDPDF